MPKDHLKMEIFFQDPDDIPLPPEEVRIREFRAAPWEDGQRVRIYLEVDPFQKRPSAEVVILNPQGEVVSQASIVETVTRKMEFNLHLRQAEAAGEGYTARAVLYYRALPDQPPDEVELPEAMIVDQRQVELSFP